MPADVPTDVPADVSADVPACVPACVPADVPADAPADVPAGMPADVPADAKTTPQVQKLAAGEKVWTKGDPVEKVVLVAKGKLSFVDIGMYGPWVELCSRYLGPWCPGCWPQGAAYTQPAGRMGRFSFGGIATTMKLRALPPCKLTLPSHNISGSVQPIYPIAMYGDGRNRRTKNDVLVELHVSKRRQPSNSERFRPANPCCLFL